ncbi:MAG: class I tRNA ligase family protein [Thermoprotei archaeon]
MVTLVATQVCFDPDSLEWLRSAVAADVYVRALAASGDVVFATGLEAYSSKTLHESKVKGVDVRAHLAAKRRTLGRLIEQLHLSPNIVGDTSDPRHVEYLTRAFTQLTQSGTLGKFTVERAVCADDGELFDEVVGMCAVCGSKIEGLGGCPTCGTILTPSNVSEARCGICDSPLNVAKSEESAYGFKGGVQSTGADLAVSSTLGWGVPLPGEQGRTFAPWFSGVLAPLSFAARETWEKNGGEATIVQFTTRRFGAHHAELLPQLLEALGAPRGGLRVVVAGGFKLSGKGKPLRVTSTKLLTHLDSDFVRYALSRWSPDVNVDVDVYELQKNINEELVDTLSQLTHRVLQFAYSKFGSIPKPGELREEDSGLIGLMEPTFTKMIYSISSFNFADAYTLLHDFATKVGEYYTLQAPWTTLRSDPERAATVVYVALEGVRVLSVLAQPLLPEFSAKVRSTLGLPPLASLSLDEVRRPLTPDGRLSEPKPAYTKLADKQVEALISDCAEGDKPEIELAEFLRLDLRVAIIIAAERVANTKRLLRLRVRIGDKLRTIVSSIGEQYTPDELVGKSIVVLTNLKPSTFAGVTSRGMLLAAEGDGVISLLTPMREVKDGSWVH